MDGETSGGSVYTGELRCTLCGIPTPAGAVLRVGDVVICAQCKPAYLQMVREGVPIMPLHLAPGDEATLQTLIGRAWPLYFRKFNALAKRRLRFSWNWPAFLFGGIWMVYRKMYLWGCLLLSLDLVLVFIEGYFNIPDGITIVYDLASSAVVGAYGNLLYHVHLRRMRKRVDQETSNPAERTAWLARVGGTNLAASLVVAFLSVGLGLGLAYLQDPDSFSFEEE